MFTLAVNDSNDIYVYAQGNIATARNLEALKQKIKQRLKLFYSEWFLDTTRGVPYFQNILGEDINQSLAAQIITTEIQKEPDVTGVENVNFGLNDSTRKFTYLANVQSVYGEIQVVN